MDELTHAPPYADSPQAGFAAADGLMALTLVSMLAVVVAGATMTGIRNVRVGDERRAAAAEAEYRLMTEWPRLRAAGERSGRDGALAWRLTATLDARADDGSGLCRVTNIVRVLGSGRAYRLDTHRFCRTDGPR